MEVLSSTERAWQTAERAFHPNIFVDVSNTIERKQRALSCYRTESRPYPHPRSVEGVEYLARKRGLEVGVAHAEAFQLVRRIER
jgi:LmbE family N-acetylglucosaminyl deacetylase